MTPSKIKPVKRWAAIFKGCPVIDLRYLYKNKSSIVNHAYEAVRVIITPIDSKSISKRKKK